MKQLSIITICYNDIGAELTCKSIIEQKNQDFEWIVIDGGSNDEIQKVFNKYKFRIDKFISEPDNGIYDAYNKGLKLASGEYIIFMNSGDSFYDEEVLSALNSILSENYEVIYGLTELSYNCKKNNLILNYPKELSPKFFINQNINTQSTFIKRELFDKFGFYGDKYKVLSDKEKWIQFIKAGIRFKYVPIVIAKYDMNGLSSNEATREKTYKDHWNILHEYYSQEEIDEVYTQTESSNSALHVPYKQRYSILEQIFSIKNSTDKSHKVITINGIHFKIKRKV